MHLATNIHHMSGHCWKGFQSQRSKVKVMTRPANLTTNEMLQMVAGTAMVQQRNVILVIVVSTIRVVCRTRVSEPRQSRRPVHSTRCHVGADDGRVRGAVVLVATVCACRAA